MQKSDLDFIFKDLEPASVFNVTKNLYFDALKIDIASVEIGDVFKVDDEGQTFFAIKATDKNKVQKGDNLQIDGIVWVCKAWLKHEDPLLWKIEVVSND